MKQRPIFFYLAVPYSHPDKHVRAARNEIVTSVSAYMMGMGMHVFSPITHSHHIAEKGNLPNGWDYWGEQDSRYIEMCDRLIVLTLPGWLDSEGVTAEIKLAEELGKPISYIDWGEFL